MKTYDVIIAGGGPAGATLAALLARTTNLSIAIYESHRFPREHIGESFTQRLTAVLEESGALAKVLKSACFVKKYGGYYAWNDGDPAVSLFEHSSHQRDGILRWSFHADRAQMDCILLDHAESCGVTVVQGNGVKHVEVEDDATTVELSDRTRVRCRFFVDATGRVTGLVDRQRKRFLSDYRNIAIWTHVLGGAPAQTARGDWNVFRKMGVSSIANYAFDEGWFWYIPVPKLVNGERVISHSLGLVTDPRVLKTPHRDYTDVDRLIATAKKLPILGELIKDAVPLYRETLTATNYSMIGERFGSFEERWLSVGDASCFVDPLFSSGVAFAVNHAASAALVIRSWFDDSMTDESKRDLFDDYDVSWRRIAASFALVLDQWYYAISNGHPGSMFWRSRVNQSVCNVREATFNALVDSAVSPDLLHVMTKGKGRLEDLGSEGPLMQLLGERKQGVLSAEARLVLDPAVEVRKSVMLGIGRSKDQVAHMSFSAGEAHARLSAYWHDPIANGRVIPPIYDRPFACHRFAKGHTGVSFFDARDGGLALRDRLLAQPTYGELSLSGQQEDLLRRLIAADLVQIRAAKAA